MSAIAIEAPALSRQDIVNVLRAKLEGKIAETRAKIEELRGQMQEPSEVDREAKMLHHASVNADKDGHEHSVRGMVAFLTMLGDDRESVSYITAGNMIVLHEDGERNLWVLYDPKALHASGEYFISLDGIGIEEELGLDSVLAMTTICPIGEALVGSPVTTGEEVRIVVGNVLNKFTIESVL